MIIVVAGTSCTGKTEFIKHKFPDYRRIDWFDYQTGGPNIHKISGALFKRYERFLDDIAEAAKSGGDIVIENTLYKKLRRTELIEKIRSVSDAPIYLYVMEISVEKYVKNYLSRFPDDEDPEGIYEYEKAEIEPYTDDEGFTKIYRVRDGEGDFNWRIE